MEPNHGKVLPRGLEQVSHLLLSNVPPRPPAKEEVSRPSGEPAQDPREESATLVLLRGRFLERQQLVSLLRENAPAIEEGLRVIDRDIPCDPVGSIELLALDWTNKPALIEVEDHSGDALLFRGIEHFDWIVRNMANVRRMYSGYAVNFNFPPRIFLVAPDFSPSLRCVARHIAATQIQCLRYRSIAL